MEFEIYFLLALILAISLSINTIIASYLSHRFGPILNEEFKEFISRIHRRLNGQNIDDLYSPLTAPTNVTILIAENQKIITKLSREHTSVRNGYITTVTNNESLIIDLNLRTATWNNQRPDVVSKPQTMHATIVSTSSSNEDVPEDQEGSHQFKSNYSVKTRHSQDKKRKTKVNPQKSSKSSESRNEQAKDEFKQSQCSSQHAQSNKSKSTELNDYFSLQEETIIDQICLDLDRVRFIDQNTAEMLVSKIAKKTKSEQIKLISGGDTNNLLRWRKLLGPNGLRPMDNLKCDHENPTCCLNALTETDEGIISVPKFTNKTTKMSTLERVIENRNMRKAQKIMKTSFSFNTCPHEHPKSIERFGELCDACKCSDAYLHYIPYSPSLSANSAISKTMSLAKL